MALPTKAEVFAQLIEHLRKGQEACATLSHLHADESKLTSQGWMAVSEMLKLTIHQVTQLATKGRLH